MLLLRLLMWAVVLMMLAVVRIGLGRSINGMRRLVVRLGMRHRVLRRQRRGRRIRGRRICVAQCGRHTQCDTHTHDASARQ